jgi:TonB-linked SusC/RagA family outer membrane protein
MSIKLVFIGFLVILSNSGFSQLKMVKGKITSADDSQPLVGTNITVQGTTRGVVADIEGNYVIEVMTEDRFLSFSFIGYFTQIIEIGSQTSINVLLQPDLVKLEEVVVIGYGTVRKSDLTGSVSSIKGKDLVSVPSASPLQALQGKVAGVQISSASGAPGAGVVVRVRGIGTTGNSNPLFVVDGVFTDDVNFLNPADIQSIEVLKDASATAIYGSRGANGVFLITTKRGAQGQESINVSINIDHSVQNLQNRIDLLSGKEFATVVNEITPGSFNNVDAVPNNDWQNLIFQTAPISNYQASVSGASKKSQFYFGVGYFKQGGIIPKSDFERITIKLNNTFHLAKNLRVGSNLTITPSQSQNAFGGAVFNAYRSQPTIAARLGNGGYSPVPGVGNVLADIEYTNSFGSSTRGLGNLFAEVDILKGLTFKSSFGVDATYDKSRSFTPVFFVSTLQQNPINDLNKSWNDRFFWLWENTMSYSKELGKHRIGAVAGYTSQSGKSESFGIAGQNILRESEDFWYINPNNINPNSVTNGVDFNFNYSMVSYLFRANYAFDNKYLLTLTYRRDGSSKFSRSNQFSNFPAFALGWNIINEGFMKNQKIFSNAKLRGSWGIVGNEKIDYAQQYSRVLNGINAVFGKNETIIPGSTYGVSGNPNLVWENSFQTDVGVEVGFLDDRLTMEVDYFSRLTKDILILLPVPGYLGNGDGAAITFNSGEVLNRGFELSLGYKGTIGKAKYQLHGNGTSLHNEMKRISGNQGPGDFIQNQTGTTRTYVGDAIGSFFGYRAIGVFQNQADLDNYPHRSDAGIGDLKFEDLNKDGKLTADDRTKIGSPIPALLYGFGADFSFKNFDFTVDFQGQVGSDIYNYKETVRPDLYNFEQRVFNRWRGEGTSNVEPRSSTGGYNFLPSNRFIQSGSFLRLRTVSLGYTLPSSMAAKIRSTQARVFIRATNLFTISNFSGYTPEIGSGSVIDSNIDFGTYPIPAIYSAGLSLTF